MATNVGKIKSDRVSIKGALNSRAPAPKAGETHVTFDGSIHVHRSVSALRVAGVRRNTEATFYWFEWLEANAGSFTEFTDASTIVASDFDLVVIDHDVWAGNAERGTALALLDAGTSVVFTGNDTTYTNISSGRTGSSSGSHTVIYDPGVPDGIDTSMTVGDIDLIGGMDTLLPGAEPLYYRSDSGQVTGLIYTSSVSGAKLFFSQENFRDTAYGLLQTMSEYVARYSTARISTTGVTLLPDGLYVQPGTTNLEADKSSSEGVGKPFQSLSHCSAEDVTGQPGVPLPPFEGARVWKITGGSSSGYARLAMEQRNPADDWNGFDKTYVWSVHAWFPSALQVWDGNVSNVMYQNSTAVDWHGDSDYTESKPWYGRTIKDEARPFDLTVRDQWQRAWTRFTPKSEYVNLDGASGVVWASGYIQMDLPDDATNDGANFCYVSAMQVEESYHPSSWVRETPRPTGPSHFSLPVVGTPDFTLALEAEFDYARHETTAGGNYNYYLFTLEDESTGLRIEYIDWETGSYTFPRTTTRPFFNLEPDATWAATATSRHLHHTVEWTKEVPYCLFVTKSGEDLTIEWYTKDRTLVKSQTFSYSGTDDLFSTFTPTKLVIGREGSTGVWSSRVARASFFQEAVDDATKQSWIGRNLKVTTEGDLLVDELEESVYVPEDCVHFPLDYDTMDVSKSVAAEQGRDLYFEEKGVRVSTIMANYLASGEAWWTGANFSYVSDAGWYKVTAVDVTTGHWFRPRADLSLLTDGATYTCRAEVYNPSAETIHIRCSWCQTGNFDYYIPPNETMTVFATGARETYDSTFRFFDVNIRDNVGTYWVKNIQINAGEFRGGYGSHNGAYTSWLAYNMGRDLAVDWSAQWTIALFYKPVGTHVTGAKTGYCIPIALGGNGASTGYAWFGKNSNYNSIRDVSGTFAPEDFFDNWQMIVIRGDGAGTITHQYYGVSMNGSMEHIGSTRTNTTDNPTYFLTSSDVDVQLGSWSSGSTCSQVVLRDMIVHPNLALSDEEVDKIWKSWVSVNIDRARFSELYEGNL